jgi:hypothetical protein
MKLISRRKDDGSQAEGRSALEPYEQDSVKDIITFGTNEVVEVIARFAPYPGVYMWHCHNAVHEDLGMMAVMNVTKLQDLKYSELDTALEDPMDARFKARLYSGTDLEDIKTKVLPGFAALKAYPSPQKLNEAVDKYWSQRDGPGDKDTGAVVSGEKDPEFMAFHNSHHGKANQGSAKEAVPSASMGSSHHMGGMSMRVRRSRVDS